MAAVYFDGTHGTVQYMGDFLITFSLQDESIDTLLMP